MALTPAEKELLAVVKYYNDNKKDIARLVTKLNRGFDIEATSTVTGL